VGTACADWRRLPTTCFVASRSFAISLAAYLLKYQNRAPRTTTKDDQLTQKSRVQLSCNRRPSGPQACHGCGSPLATTLGHIELQATSLLTRIHGSGSATLRQTCTKIRELGDLGVLQGFPWKPPYEGARFVSYPQPGGTIKSLERLYAKLRASLSQTFPWFRRQNKPQNRLPPTSTHLAEPRTN
jgi:hypothetical protein